MTDTIHEIEINKLLRDLLTRDRVGLLETLTGVLGYDPIEFLEPPDLDEE